MTAYDRWLEEPYVEFYADEPPPPPDEPENYPEDDD